MAKKIYLQYRGSVPRPFNIGGYTGVFEPHGRALSFPESIAAKLRKIFPECVVMGSELVKDIIPVDVPLPDLDDEQFDDDLDENAHPAASGLAVELKKRTKFPLVLRDGEDTPDESWTVRDIREWFESYGLSPKQGIVKARLLELVDKAVGG